MSGLITFAVFVIVICLGPLLSVRFQDADFLFWLIVFSVHYTILNPSETVLAVARVDRNFRLIAIVHAIGAVAMLLSLGLFPWIGRWAIVLGITLWSVVPLLLSWKLIPKTGPWIERESARRILAVAVAFSAAASVQLSSGYLDRVILALWWPAEEVSAFFAAISLGMLFTTPALILSTLGLSLLGKVKDASRFSRRFLLGYAAGVLGLALGVYLIGRPIGSMVLSFFYPKQFENALPLWDLAVASAAGLSVVSLVRPFILKFRPATWMPVLSVIALAIRMPLLLLMVPNGGRVGTAQALCLGTMIISAIWLGVFLHFAFSRPNSAAVEPNGSDSVSGRK